MGDFNEKLGKEEKYKPTIGKFSKHDITNDNGRRLIEFALDQNFRIMSTYFDHKEVHKQTWVARNGRTINQIDQIAAEEAMQTLIIC